MNYYNYFTEIEEYFVQRRGKNLTVSPLDWSLIATWRDSGVPLHVALRGIDIAMSKFFSGKRRQSERPGTLFYCHDTVMAEYAGYLEAHVGEARSSEGKPAREPEREEEEEDGPGRDRVLKFIGERIFEIKRAQAKHLSGEVASEGIRRVAGRLEELAVSLESAARIDGEALERDLRVLDDLLVNELKPEAGPERLVEWERESKKELKVYRKRLPKETYEKIRENYIRGKIRRQFNIGELSLFHL